VQAELKMVWKGCAGAYRYGYGTQEKDTDIGEGIYTAQYWEYDSRLGRRWNVDPLFRKYPWQSPYAAFNNSPILFNDPLGLEGEQPQNHKVNAGESLSKLAKNFGVTVDAIKAANSTANGGKIDWNKRGANHDIIRTGETLNIPVKPTKTPQAPQSMPAKNTSTPKPHLSGITTQETSVFKQIVKFGHDLDKKMEGNDDGGNQGGYLGGQQGWEERGGKELFLGTIAVVVAPFTIGGGVVAILNGAGIEGSAYVTAGVVGGLNGLDDVLTNTKKESFTQQLVNDPNWKENITTIKRYATFFTFFAGGVQGWRMGVDGPTILGISNDGYSLLRPYIEQ